MPFRLLDLPAEIRVRIHAVVLVQQHPIKLENRRSGSGKDAGVIAVRSDTPKYRGQSLEWIRKQVEGVRPSTVALLRTCKSVWLEAREVAYGQNTFSFLNTATATRFMELVGSAMKFVRHVILQPKGYSLAGASVFFNRLARASNLRVVQISHTDCCEREGVIDGIALHSVLMLSLLQNSYERREIAKDVLDVIQLQLTECSDHVSEVHYHRSLRMREPTNAECFCVCGSERKENKNMASMLRARIAKSLHDLNGTGD